MKVDEILAQCCVIHTKKAHDYASDKDKHSNFKFIQYFIAMMDTKSRDDIPYLVLIGVKLARIKELLNSSKEPQNESLQDSFIDLINYIALWQERMLGE